jgi:hypothetical protein
MYATMAATLAASFGSILLGFAIGTPISHAIKRRRAARHTRGTDVATGER